VALRGRRGALRGQRPRFLPPLPRDVVPSPLRAPHAHAPPAHRFLGQLLQPFPGGPPRRRKHAAPQPVAVGHGRRVRLPVPELLPIPCQDEEQDRTGDRAIAPVRPGLECVWGFELPSGAGGEEYHYSDSGAGEGGARAVYCHGWV